MKAYVYLNNAEHSFFGWKPEHAGSLELGGVLTLGDRDDWNALEDVFQVCNGADPQSEALWYIHGNRSLSVGDVVLLERDGRQQAWSCDSTGWTALPDGVVRVFPVPAPK